MGCYSPLQGYRMADGSVGFKDRGDVISRIDIACGQCIGCRLERARQWSARIMHEASLHSSNAFVTLTYRPECLPANGSLDYRDFQLFMKRLRKACGKVRFYMCGEYGENFQRPHFHAILFGVDFPDKVLWRRTTSGALIWRSELLERCWPHGFSSIGEVTLQSAGYVSRYVLKKITGDRAKNHYLRADPETGEIVEVVPEFNRMSLKPGIGRQWIEKYLGDVYPHDRVIVKGQQMKPPRYYDKVLQVFDADMADDLVYTRHLKAKKVEADSTPERRAVKEYVKKAQISRLKRNSF